MRRLTTWVLAHRKLVVLIWVVITVAGVATVSSTINSLSRRFEIPGREGSQTNVAIGKIFHTGGNTPPLISVVTLPGQTTVDSPGVDGQLRQAFTKISTAVPGSRIASYQTTGNRLFVSADGRTTFAAIFPPIGSDPDISPALLDAAKRATASAAVMGSPVHLTGTGALTAGGGGGGAGVFVEAVIGAIGALLVLAFVFASFIAFLPLLIAIVSIFSTFLVIGGLTHITSISFIVQFLVALIGLGVAIDYALLVVVRWREEHQKGADNETAVQTAMATAGRAVVFSGTTVGVGLLSLIVLPIPFIRSLGYGGMLIPVMTVLVSITLLPVILVSVGPKWDWPRVRHDDTPSRGWTRWATFVVRHRIIAALTSTALLVLLAIPAFHLYQGNPRADSLAKSGDAQVGLTELERSGIGSGVLTPFEGLVKTSGAATTVQTASAVTGIRGAVAPNSPQWSRDGVSLVDVFPRVDGNSRAGRKTLDRLRAATSSGMPRYGGDAAQSKDFVTAVNSNFPLMVGLIMLITYFLLARAFRSLILPLKAVVLNVLSVAAAYGILVWVWQDGHLSKAIWGIQSTGAITEWVPLMVFAFLFGLSMDYEVFILVRVREEYDKTGSTDEAVIRGIGRTGRLVTSAALVLFLAFAALASGPETAIKTFATGLAAGILLDATVVRGILVPALVSIFGTINWWMPKRIARILRIQDNPSTD